MKSLRLRHQYYIKRSLLCFIGYRKIYNLVFENYEIILYLVYYTIFLRNWLVQGNQEINGKYIKVLKLGRYILESVRIETEKRPLTYRGRTIP